MLCSLLPRHVRPVHFLERPAPQEMSAPAEPLVLVVDDRKDVAAVLAEMCRAYGFSAKVAENDVDMLTLLQRHHPAGVIVDMMMPHQDGFEAMKEIAQYDRFLP